VRTRRHDEDLYRDCRGRGEEAGERCRVGRGDDDSERVLVEGKSEECAHAHGGARNVLGPVPQEAGEGIRS
jgi:hypothetical protein